jgi:tetratricopeptide (TPR) repeat protein
VNQRSPISTAFAVLVGLAVECGVQHAAAQPALPALPIESFPAAARQLIEARQRAAMAQPNDADAVGAFARALHAWEQWQTAHEAYTRAAALAPNTFDWQYLDAVVLQRLARHGDAVTRLRSAVKVSTAYLPARVKLAEALLESGELVESQGLFTQLVREPATAPAAEVGLGRIAAAQQQPRLAIAHFERAVSLFPELGAAHYGLALAHRALGNREQAQRALEQHQRYGPRWPAIDDPVLDSVTGLREDASAILQRGVKQADAGDIDAAIAAHEDALARDPGLTQAHANLIALYGRTRNWAKAEEHYRAAVKAGSGLADAHYDYAVLLGLQEKWELAERAYRDALAVNPMHVQAHNNLGQVLERQRNFNDAAESYRRAVESQPGFRLARFNLARMLIALGRPAEAAAELEKTVEPRDAEAPRYLFALGVAYVRAGRKEEGIKWSLQARALALQLGQNELAASIDRELKQLK